MEPIIVTSRATISEVVAAALETALKQALPPLLRQATTKPYLTKKELMDLTGWSSRQIEYKKAGGEIAYFRRGRTVLFPTEAVVAYLDEGYVPSNQERCPALRSDRQSQPGGARGKGKSSFRRSE